MLSSGAYETDVFAPLLLMDLNDQHLWRDFEDFLWKFQFGYFFETQWRKPWGNWLITEAEDESLVWRGHADFGAENMARELAAVSAKLGIVHYGVYLSSSWQGDVAAFTDDLRQMGWRNTINVHWLVKDVTQFVPVPPPEGYECVTVSLADAAQFPGLLGIHDKVAGRETHAGYLFTEPRFSADVTRHIALVKLKATQEIIGYGLVAQGDDFGFLYALGVLPEHRNRGVAKALVSARWQVLHNAGVTQAVTAVVAENAASLNVQQGQGYRIFATTHAWQPPGSGTDLYKIAEELRAKE